jgi:hypothetical protein
MIKRLRECKTEDKGAALKKTMTVLDAFMGHLGQKLDNLLVT